MGFFSTNEHTNLYKSYEFPVVEGYDDTIGCGLALIEGYQNDFALFTAAVQSDLSETALLREGDNYQLISLQEASISGMLEAIKKFFIKLGAKIKAIFTGFMAKIESYFTKDLKGYVKKYENSLARKDFKDMKVKYANPKNGTYVNAEIYNPSKYTIKISKKYNGEGIDSDTVNKEYENKDRSDYIEDAYKHLVDNKITNNADFDDYYHDSVYDTEEVKDDWDYGKVREVATRLTANTKLISEIKKFYDKVNGDIKKMLKEIDDEDKRITNLYKNNKNKTGATGSMYTVSVVRDKDNRTGSGVINNDYGANKGSIGNLDIATKQVQMMRQSASAYQDVILHISQVVMKEAKFGIAQDKRVFAKAVAYKTITGESTLLDIIEECAFDETMEDLDRRSA